MNKNINLSYHTIEKNEIWYAVKHKNSDIRLNSRSGGGVYCSF